MATRKRTPSESEEIIAPDRRRPMTQATPGRPRRIAAKLAITALKTHYVTIAPLLQRAGLSAHDFEVRQQRISAASQGKFLEYAAEALDDSAFGLHLAKQANPREAGCCIMSLQPRATSARRWRSLRVTAGSPTKRCALNTHMRGRGSLPRSASSAFPGIRRNRLPNLASASRLGLCERSRVGISVRRT